MAKKNVAKKDLENKSDDDYPQEENSNKSPSEEIIGKHEAKSRHKTKKASKKEANSVKKEKSNIGKIVFFSLVGILVVLGIIMIILSYKDGSVTKDSSAAATINGEDILLSDLENMYNRLPETTRAQVTKTELLDQMINEKVLMQEAEKQGLNVSQSEITDFLDKLLLQSGVSKQEFINRLNIQNITEKMVNDEIYKQLLITKLYQKEIIDKIIVTETDISYYYNDNIEEFNSGERVEASHILICHKDSLSCESNLTKEEALAKINSIKSQVTKDDFAALAKKYSQDGSAVEGGELGFFERGTMVKPFEDAAFSTNIGEISNIVETQYGFHIILVTDKKAASTTPLSEISSEIEQIVLSEKQQDSFKTYLENIKDKSEIDIIFKETTN